MVSSVSDPATVALVSPARSALADRTAWLACAALLLVLPFQRMAPALVLFGQALSNVEATLALGLAAWTVALLLARRRPPWTSPLTAPALALLAVLIVSALAAPTDRANAVKSVARFVAGLCVFVMTVNAATTRGRVASLMTLAVSSGIVVGTIGLLERLEIDPVVVWLRQFRDQRHFVGGQLRIASTLWYPTITAMYLEIVFALGLGLLVLAVDRKRRMTAAILFAGLLAIAEAIALTLTRAGLMTMGCSLLVAGGALWLRRGRAPATRAVAALAAAVVAAVAVTAPAQALWLRLTSSGDEDWYRAEYRVPARLELGAGELSTVGVTLRNAGRITWEGGGDAPFRLSYHWLNASGDRVVEYDGLRSPLPQTIAPGESVTVRAGVKAPAWPGRYRLAWDVTQEGRLWFSVQGAATVATDVTITSNDAAASAPRDDTLLALPAPKVRVGRLALWRIAAVMIAARPVVGVGFDNFRLLYGRYGHLPQADDRVHSNNMYIEHTVGAGLAGGAVFFWLLWRLVASLWRIRPRLDDRIEPLYVGIAAAVAAILVHGLLDSFWTFTPTYLAIWITFGLATAVAALAAEEGHAHRV